MRSLEDVAEHLAGNRRALTASPLRVQRERVYICGPMTGVADLNHPAFHLAEAQLQARGLEVVSPARLVTDGRAWHLAMRVCIQHLLTCQHVALLPGWSRSRGACREIDIAHDCEIPVRLLWEYL